MDVAVLGGRGAQEVVGGVPHRRVVAEVEPDQAPLGLVGDRVATELQHHREPELRGRDPGLLGGGTVRSRSTGTPYSASRRLESASERVVDV